MGVVDSMNLNRKFVGHAAVFAVMGVLFAGCSTPTIPITMNVAGEIKLSGINKIAIADFNSLPGDPFSGVMAADAETCALVKRAVASSFYASPMYQIADMEVEKSIFDSQGAQAKSRYDAIIYGRLWWNMTQETQGSYPQKFTLESWRNVPYTMKNLITGKPEKAVAHVTTRFKDVIEMLEYRVRNATLMLSLSVYRLDGDGKLTKIVDTYQVTDQGFMLVNGELKLDDANDVAKGENKVDANGKIILTQETVSMPTELQAKLMLAASVTKNLSAQIAPSKRTFDVTVDLGDVRLENLLKNGAFASSKDYSIYMLRQKIGKQNCEKLAQYLPVFADPCAYPIPDSEDQLDGFRGDTIDELLANEDIAEYFADEDLDPYFYALGICGEATQNLDEAEDYYRFAFYVNPSIEYARGLSRVYFTRGQSARLRETKKAKAKK